MFRRLAFIALACAIAAACSQFDATDDATPGTDAGADASTDSTVIDATVPPGDAQEARAPSRCTTETHALCDDFDDTEGGASAFPRWSSAARPELLERVTEGATSPPFALRVNVPVGAANASRPYLEAVIPIPKAYVTCTANIRIASAVATNTLEVSVVLLETDDAGASGLSAGVFFLGAAGREVGVYRAFTSGQMTYNKVSESMPLPHNAKVVQTTFRVDLAGSPKATISWDGATPLSYAFGDGGLPPSVSGAAVRFGARGTSPAAGTVDIRYDDIVCDVE